MKEEVVFQQFRMWRNWTIAAAEGLNRDIIMSIPHGFSNNILWNLGHILVGWDHGIFSNLSKERHIPQNYHLMFPSGSKPIDWHDEPPKFEEIIEQLRKQPDEIIEQCQGKLDLALAKPFLHLTTVGDMFLFQISHESLHMGTVTSINRILSGN